LGRAAGSVKGGREGCGLAARVVGSRPKFSFAKERALAMTMQAAEHAVAAKVDPHFGTASHGKIGMWIFLLTDGMGFAGLLIGLAITRAGSATWPPDPEVDKLGIPFTAVMTFVLILSSVTMVMALAACEDKNKKATMGWLAATIGGGLFFLLGQVREWTSLIREGMTVSHDHFGAFFYVVTGYHGLHVFTGVCYLTACLIRTARKGTTHEHANFLEIAGLFWHFVDLVWILVFTFIYLIPSPHTVAAAVGVR
jgi:heme/copper-type cytochrome/quinol oxidase subunit 3